MNFTPVSRIRARQQPRRHGRPATTPHQPRPVAAEPAKTFTALEHDPTPVDFSGLPIDPRLLKAVVDLGFTQTTAVQSAVFPHVHAGLDLIASAQTGTGKTVAFLLPIMQRLLTTPRSGARATRVLVLAPTRELAAQIEEDFRSLSRHVPLSAAVVFGGVGAGAQIRALRSQVDLVVATPGRLLDHIRTGAARFGSVEVLVLDEADRMVDMGFWPDVRRIVDALPAARQTLLFSATLSADVTKAAGQIMREPRLVQVGRATGLASSIRHVGQMVRHDEKAGWLAGFLQRTSGPTIVFVRTKRSADRLARRLGDQQIRCGVLHANRSQNQRAQAMDGFRSGRVSVLVATDIAARGIDVERVGHVINYEVPVTADAYVHRVGRTGRAAETGTAMTLVAPDEIGALRSLERALKLQMSAGSDATSR